MGQGQSARSGTVDVRFAGPASRGNPAAKYARLRPAQRRFAAGMPATIVRGLLGGKGPLSFRLSLSLARGDGYRLLSRRMTRHAVLGSQ